MGAWLFGLVLQGEPNIGIGLRQPGDRIDREAALRHVVRLEGIVVSVLARPEIDEWALKNPGDFGGRAGLLIGLGSDGRVLRGEGALTPALLREMVRDDGYAGKTVFRQEAADLVHGVPGDVPGPHEFNPRDAGNGRRLSDHLGFGRLGLVAA